MSRHCEGCIDNACTTDEDFAICRENQAMLTIEALFGSARGWDNDGSAELAAAKQADHRAAREGVSDATR